MSQWKHYLWVQICLVLDCYLPMTLVVILLLSGPISDVLLKRENSVVAYHIPKICHFSQMGDISNNLLDPPPPPPPTHTHTFIFVLRKKGDISSNLLDHLPPPPPPPTHLCFGGNLSVTSTLTSCYHQVQLFYIIFDCLHLYIRLTENMVITF